MNIIRDAAHRLGQLWAHDEMAVVVGILAAAVVLLIVSLRVAGRARAASRNVKLSVGTAVVQAGVTWAVVTGTYAFCTRVFHLPRWEAVAFAVFFEAATWVSVGMIYDHAKSDKTGFGPAGPFFWLFSGLGGLLAITGGNTGGEMLGRAVVVTFGAGLWYLLLLRVVKRSTTPGTWRWTPRRLLVAVGAIEPGDQDVTDQHREWQIRRLARAMRWANSSRPWSWLGRRALIQRGEATQEDVIRDARRRYAVAHLLTTTSAPTSEVMRRVIADVTAGDSAGGSSAAEQQDAGADVAALCEAVLEQARRARLEVSRNLAWRPAPMPLPSVATAELALPAAADVDGVPPDPWAYATPLGGDGGASEPATEADTEPANPTATVADTPPAMRSPARSSRNRTPAAKKTASKPANATAAKVAKLRAKEHDITQAEVARRLKISIRTVSRHWADTAPAAKDDTEADIKPVNGTAVDLAITP